MSSCISILGSTGSIGRQTLDVVDKLGLRVAALTANRDVDRLEAQCRKYRPKLAAMMDEAAYKELKARLSDMNITVVLGLEGLITAASLPEADTVVTAVSGMVGLKPTLAAIREKKRIALANKESLVCGGELVLRAVKRYGAQLVPVDSEHSAIFQCLAFRRDAAFDRLVLTASGGPFLHLSQEELRRVTAADALRHPTWNMGAKITVDSATLLNKGYEVIEAHWLYDAPFEKIDAVVHPESIVHSLVLFSDGAALAQLGYPDMRVPIQLALTYPERLPCEKPLDLAALGRLTFLPFPAEKFPCYGLAVAAGKAGGTLPVVLNAAAEEAVRAFLAGRITFPAIAETIQDALGSFPREEADSFERLAGTDARVRAHALSFIYGKSAS